MPYNTYNTLVYYHNYYSCNKYCDPICHSQARDYVKRSEIVDLQLTNQIPGLLYLTIPYNTYNTYITLI